MRKRTALHVLFVLTLFQAGLSGAAGATGDGTGPPAVGKLTYRVVRAIPHDPRAFTQGLAIDGGALFESTGLRGRSALRRIDLATGRVLQSHILAPSLFGEGMTVLAGRIYQLTWQAGAGFVYDRETLRPLKTFRYRFEGWGLAHDGTHLIASDGTAVLRFLDPADGSEVGQVRVTGPAGPVSGLNELEYVEGKLYANVWQTDRIAVIDPRSGRLEAWIELEGLLDRAMYRTPVDVLNGIAYDADTKKLYVTGKLWPTLFQIEVIDPNAPGDGEEQP